jgi:lysyl-tRNA synthetase class I
MKYNTDISDEVLNGFKRLYVDLSDLRMLCPNCGRITYTNTEMFEEGDTTIDFYCKDFDGDKEYGCEHEWSVRPKNITATLSIEIDFNVMESPT